MTTTKTTSTTTLNEAATRAVYALVDNHGMTLRDAIAAMAGLSPADNFVFSHPYGASNNPDLAKVFIVETFEVVEDAEEDWLLR